MVFLGLFVNERYHTASNDAGIVTEFLSLSLSPTEEPQMVISFLMRMSR